MQCEICYYCGVGRIQINIEGFKCDRCGHAWIPRQVDMERGVPAVRPPVVCPKCKSPYWDIPRKAKKTKRK